MNDKNLNILSVDVAKLPSEQVKIIDDVVPKFKSKSKYIQKILIKLFGYNVKYKTVEAKVLKIKASDVPSGFDGNLTIDIN